MHEIGLMQEALDIAIDTAEQDGAHKITTLRMNVGALSSVEPDALTFAFETLSRETIAEGASLLLEPVSPSLTCASCSAEFIWPSRHKFCPKCGHATLVRKGYELQVKSIEVE